MDRGIIEVARGDEPAAAEPGATTSTPSWIKDGKVDWNALPKDARFEVEVQGQPVVVTGDRIRDMVSMGYRFSDRMREVTERELNLERQYAPLVKFDDFIKNNPDVRKIVRAAASRDWPALRQLIPAEGRPSNATRTAPGFTPGDGGEPGNGGGDGGSDYYLEQMRGMQENFDRQMNVLREGITEQLGGVAGSVQTLTARAADAEAVQFLKTDRRFARIATDDNIALARDWQRQNGGDLISAFRNATYDKLPALVESDVIERYGIDKERFEMPGSSSPISGGVTLDQGTLDELFKDPEKLRPHVEAIRAHRRRQSGKMRYPGLARK